MSVLDPFEVYEIEVFPLPQFEEIQTGHPSFKAAKQHLDALEYEVHQKAVGASVFLAILNEKEPEIPAARVPIPLSARGCIVSDRVRDLRRTLTSGLPDGLKSLPGCRRPSRRDKSSLGFVRLSSPKRRVSNG